MNKSRTPETDACECTDGTNPQCDQLAETSRRLEMERNELRWLMKEVLDFFEGEIPDAQCSCHVNPPCGDCVDYGGIRETMVSAAKMLNREHNAKGKA